MSVKQARVERGCTASRPMVTATVACTALTLAAPAAPDARNVLLASLLIEAGRRHARPAIPARSSTRRGAASVWRAPSVKRRIQGELQPACRAPRASCRQCQDPAHAGNAVPVVSRGKTGPPSARSAARARISQTTGPPHARCALLAHSRLAGLLLCVSAVHQAIFRVRRVVPSVGSASKAHSSRRRRRQRARRAPPARHTIRRRRRIAIPVWLALQAPTPHPPGPPLAGRAQPEPASLQREARSAARVSQAATRTSRGGTTAARVLWVSSVLSKAAQNARPVRQEPLLVLEAVHPVWPALLGRSSRRRARRGVHPVQPACTQRPLEVLDATHAARALSARQWLQALRRSV